MSHGTHATVKWSNSVPRPSVVEFWSDSTPSKPCLRAFSCICQLQGLLTDRCKRRDSCPSTAGLLKWQGLPPHNCRMRQLCLLSHKDSNMGQLPQVGVVQDCGEKRGPDAGLGTTTLACCVHSALPRSTLFQMTTGWPPEPQNTVAAHSRHFQLAESFQCLPRAVRGQEGRYRDEGGG